MWEGDKKYSGQESGAAFTAAQQIKWFNIFVSEALLALPPSFPLEFLHLEELLMTSYICARSDRSERACAQIC